MDQSGPINDEIWRDFDRQLRTYVRGRVDPQWVDDVVGNILIRLVKNRDALETADNPAAYVQRVSANMVTDHYRRRAAERRALAQIEADAETLAADAPPADDDAHRAISACMHPFIQNLPAPYRDALTLTEIEQLTQKQAARRLNLSLSGLKSRVQRGRSLLKRDLTRCCQIEIDRRGQVIDFEPNPDRSGTAC